MSNDRCVSDYLPLAAYTAALQTMGRGDLWPYSTRAVEARGGRYKRIQRKVVCHRKRAAEIWRSVRNVRLGTVSFKKQSYNSNSTLQMLRTGCAQETSAHGLHGRSRLSTTGRKTLVRTMPKWQEAELPEMGRLLDVAAVVEMLERANEMLTGAVGFETSAHIDTARHFGSDTA